MRYPIYFGQSTLAFGTFISSNSAIIIIFPILVMAINTFRAFKEEEHLTEEFGDEYKEYQTKVNKWFFY
jgi:protein-S-isoprenylcysteine O-methyltransferase Ste14